MRNTRVFASSVLMIVALAGPASAWDYAVETDAAGLEFGRVSAEDTSGSASIYTECTKGVGMGLALILKASDTMIDQYGGQSAEILYMNDVDGTALASVDYAPGQGVLTLVTPVEDTIRPAWDVLAEAKETLSVRFTLPPFPQIYSVQFETAGAVEAIDQLKAYCN